MVSFSADYMVVESTLLKLGIVTPTPHTHTHKWVGACPKAYLPGCGWWSGI